jgi:hypothetical protein
MPLLIKMETLQKIFEDYKNGNILLNDAINVTINHILTKPTCEDHHGRGSDVKYLQWQDRWYCCDCQDCIGDTRDFFKGYENGDEEEEFRN